MSIFTMLVELLGGMITSTEIFILTLLFSLPFGLLIAFGRMSKNKAVQNITKVYISIMRGTPLMLQILFIYYGLPFIIDGFTLPAFPAAIIAFVLNYAAYFAEIFRGGIQSIDRGQYEAARMLGLTYGQTMRRIVIPQMIRRVLPPMSNETINLVKDTSLIYILAMNDLLRVARSIVQREFDMTPFVVAGVFYLAMTFVLTWGFGRLEAHFAKYDA